MWSMGSRDCYVIFGARNGVNKICPGKLKDPYIIDIPTCKHTDQDLLS